MIRHLMKLIWNERRSNAWILFEYLLVFIVLWFCCDFLYMSYHTYHGKLGFDIDHTYRLTVGRMPSSLVEEEEKNVEQSEVLMIFMDRLNQSPDIEAVGLAKNAVPWLGSTGHMFRVDTMNYNIRTREVSSGYFEVFRIPVEKGKVFDWLDHDQRNHAVISPLAGDKFGDHQDYHFPASDLEYIQASAAFDGEEAGQTYYVTGITGPVFDDRVVYSMGPSSTVYKPLDRNDLRPQREQILIRVRPEADRDFPEKFMREMGERLSYGAYYVTGIHPISYFKRRAETSSGIISRMNGVYSITLFIVFNIFLGILGTFWFRTQTRRGQIGLRMAMGSTRKKVRNLFVFETLLMLSFAALVGQVVCLNLAKIDILKELGLPTISRSEWGFGAEQDFINFGITFLFLAMLSTAAVWYPARQASNIQPAEALHEE